MSGGAHDHDHGHDHDHDHAPAPANGQLLGFLQLCADRRFHRTIMTRFEHAAGLVEWGYWIEATAGGAPALEPMTPTAAFCLKKGATRYGWSAHGDDCGGFHGVGDHDMERKLEEAVRARVAAFPAGTHHWAFLARDHDDDPSTPAEVDVWTWDRALGALVRVVAESGPVRTCGHIHERL